MPHFFIYLLKVNIALIVFYLLYYFLLRRLTFYTLNRWFLLGSILVASSFPFIHFDQLFSHINNNQGSIVISNYIPNWNKINIVLTAIESNLTVWNLLYIIYWLGVIVMLIIFFLQIFSLLNIHRSATKNKQSIFTTYKDIQPLSFFKNIYINPTKHSSEELQTILKHEKVHTSQWHTLDLLLAEMNKIVYWFNPGVWLLKNAIRENLEFIADKKILESGIDAKQYQYELLHVITGTHKATAIATQFSLLHLKNRITMMNKQRSGKWNKIKYLLLVPILGIVAVVVAQKNSKRVMEEAKLPARQIMLMKDNDLEDFISRHKKIKTAQWGFINAVTTTDARFKEIITTGPFLNITFRNEKFDMYQYNLQKDKIRFKANYGEDMPIPSTGEISDIGNPNVANNTNNDYEIVVKTISGVRYAIAYDKNWKEISRINLVESNTKAIKAWEVIYGNIPVAPGLPAASTVNNGPETLPSVTALAPSKDEVVMVTAERITSNVSNMNIEMNENDATVKISNYLNFKAAGKNGVNPLYVVDGIIIPIYELNLIDPQQIQNIDILKGNAATDLYGDQGKNGVVLVKTKRAKILLEGNPNISFTGKKKEQPLYVINNTIATPLAFEQTNPNQIQSINVLKDKNATTLYGDLGKNGVIIIKTKGIPKEDTIPIVKNLKDKTNSTFWIGVDNPLEIVIASTTCDPKVSILNGHISGANGSYNVRVSSLGIATVIVEMNGKKYEYVYNVKLIPQPLVKKAG